MLNDVKDLRIEAPTQAGSLVVIALVAAMVAGLRLDGPAATVIAAAAMLLFGLPHGTFDLELIRRDRSARGVGLSTLLALYLGCALAMYLLWQARPVAALLFFLAIAVAHFAEDWADTGSGLFSHGIAAATLTAPVVLHRTATATIFEAVAGSADAAMVVELLVLVAPVALLLALLGVGSLLIDGHRERAVAAAATLAAMILLPPITGFALFFCMFHSPRHFAAALRSLAWQQPAQWLPVVAPLTFAASGIAALIYGFGSPIDLPARLAASAFVALSVLTVPHMAVPLMVAALSRQAGRRQARSAVSVEPDVPQNAGSWMPHSVLSQPRHRPERGSSPGATVVVQGTQPIDG